MDSFNLGLLHDLRELQDSVLSTIDIWSLTVP